MDLFGIDQSRAVYGHISARIVHVPEGQPCGEPYAVSQASVFRRAEGRGDGRL